MSKKDSSRMALQTETQSRSLQSLENCLTRTALLFSRVLTVEEAQVWKDFLASYPSEAIDYAFESWQRNGHFFPKPAAILELIRAYAVDHRGSQPIMYEHHGQGYGESDVNALWKIFHEKYPNQKKRLTYEQRQDLIDELDTRRKSA